MIHLLVKVKESEVAQSGLTLCDPMDCSLPGSSFHGILQARVLEWVAIPFSRDPSSLSKDRTWVSWIPGRGFNLWATLTLNPLSSSTYHLISSLLKLKLMSAKAVAMTVCSGIGTTMCTYRHFFSFLCMESQYGHFVCAFVGFEGVLVNECCMAMGNWVLKLDRISQNWSFYDEEISLGGDIPKDFRPHLKDNMGQSWSSVCDGSGSN